MVEIPEDEMLLSTGLLVSPGAGDTGVELQNQTPIVSHSMTAGVESFADSEASAKSTRVGNAGQGSAVHDWQREFASNDGSLGVLRELD